MKLIEKVHALIEQVNALGEEPPDNQAYQDGLGLAWTGLYEARDAIPDDETAQDDSVHPSQTGSAPEVTP